MTAPFIGEIKMFGGNFAPRGYATCEGQLISIAQNTALFALIGTIYGGNGQTTYSLPDLRGRIPIHQGITNTIGSVGGTETVTLQATQIPPHTHDLRAAAGGTKTSSPANAWFASGGPQHYASNRVSPLSGILQQGLASATGAQPHDNMMPYATVTFIIALEGIFPSRN
jgi:microcystin-dependent protein